VTQQLFTLLLLVGQESFLAVKMMIAFVFFVYLHKNLAGNNASKMSYFVSGGT